ncbi:MAG: hypothetical protein LUE14_12275, partial [Clostridiales bacterium]|nr:hypothetical protein [Clostridiales bacterium]
EKHYLMRTDSESVTSENQNSREIINAVESMIAHLPQHIYNEIYFWTIQRISQKIFIYII